MYKQTQKWIAFSDNVVEHINNYVVPQYGDEDTEPAKEYDLDDCIKQAERYLRRAKTNQRPEGLERDMRKAAHWVQKAWERIVGLKVVDDNEIKQAEAALAEFNEKGGVSMEDIQKELKEGM